LGAVRVDPEHVRRKEIEAVMRQSDRFCRICIECILSRWSRPVPPDERSGDLMQVARLALHKAEASFDHARGRFPDFAAHRVIWDVRDYLESRSAPRTDTYQIPESSTSGTDTCVQAVRRADLARAMDALDDREREVLGLWLDGVGDAEIAARTGLAPNEVSAAQKRWRRKLARALAGYEPARPKDGSDGC
jgi:RNA polymerase sigma factor (sigma-70 family)